MVRKLTIIGLVLIIAFPMFALTKTGSTKVKRYEKARINDRTLLSKSTFAAETGDFFDKSANGFGWYLGFNRKVAWDIGTGTGFGGEMVGSVYRRLNPATGTGTIGGMTGEWTGATLNAYPQIVMSESPHWGAPGGRYPYTCGFINGYLFAQFSDIDYVGTTMEGAFSTFAVADAMWGYDVATWDFGTVAATEGGATPPMAITGTGDVVYDEATGYYYWTQNWDSGDIGIDGAIQNFIVGRSMTPAVISSWVWSDYNDLSFDCTDDTSGLTSAEITKIAYCKDTRGYGTGYGIAIACATDIDDFVMIPDSTWSEIDSTTVPPDSGWVYTDTKIDLNRKLSYMYTTDWGGDDGTGDWSPNWISNGDKWFQIDPKNLFDWYGSTYSEIDTVANDTVISYFNDPQITWNISAVATEHNAVHLLLKVFGGSYDNGLAGYWIPINDDDYVAGFYHVRGLITDVGVIWGKANFISSLVGLDTFEYEFMYTNRNTLSIGYAGFGQVYATWLDRPVSRETANTWPEANTDYYDDGYLSYSSNDGDTWELPAGAHLEVEFDEEPGHIYNLYYAENITNTGTLHEEGWSVSATGRFVGGELETYVTSQYYDASEPIEDPPLAFNYHQQFLHTWKITGTNTSGITAEPVGIDMDFELMQNYPNPFNPSTEISFKIANNANVKLTVFNSNGETVVRLADGKMEKGLHRVNFDATKLNSGIYFYQLDVNGMKSTKKMVLAK